jgi:dTDP-4-amino-4,6-dideoxygalactose transaminase
VYQNYELQAERRDQLRQHLEQQGVRTILQWGGTPVHRFRELGFTVDLPRTDQLFERCLMLPMNTAIADDEVDYIVASIKSFYRS